MTQEDAPKPLPTYREPEPLPRQWCDRFDNETCATNCHACYLTDPDWIVRARRRRAQ